MPEAHPTLHGRRVLVVEDEYLLATEVASALSRQGAVVLGPVPTVAQARKVLASSGYPDVALLDVNLGGELVWPLADLLQAAHVPIVLATGYDEDVISPPYDQVPRCEKPTSLAEVLQTICKVLAGHR